MAPATVQTANSSAFAAGTNSATFLSAVTATNTIVVIAFGGDLAGGVIGTPTDNKFNTYYTAISPTVFSAGSLVFGVWYAYNVNGGAGLQVTATASAGCCCGPVTNDVYVVAREVSGLSTTDPLDRTTTAGPSTSASPSSGATSATTVASEYLVGVGVSNAPSTWTAGAGWSELLQIPPEFGVHDGAVETKVVSATGPQTVTFSLGGSATWLCGIATFKAGAPAPAVTGVSPNSGFVAGGTFVTITGSAFTGATAVHFGASAATSVVVVSDTTITCRSPAGAAGTVDVTVTTSAGTSATGSADQFTYAAAVVDARCAAGDTPLTPMLLSSAPLTL